MSNNTKETVDYRLIEDEEAMSTSESEADMREMRHLKLGRRDSRLWKAFQCLATILVLLVYTVLVVKMARGASAEDYRIIECNSPLETLFWISVLTSLDSPAPASSYIEHEYREINYLDWKKSSDFFGEPSPEVDSNWHELVRCEHFFTVK